MKNVPYYYKHYAQHGSLHWSTPLSGLSPSLVEHSNFSFISAIGTVGVHKNYEYFKNVIKDAALRIASSLPVGLH